MFRSRETRWHGTRARKVESLHGTASASQVVNSHYTLAKACCKHNRCNAMYTDLRHQCIPRRFGVRIFQPAQLARCTTQQPIRSTSLHIRHRAWLTSSAARLVDQRARLGPLVPSVHSYDSQSAQRAFLALRQASKRPDSPRVRPETRWRSQRELE